MSSTIALVRLLPWSLVGRLVHAAAEIALAATVISGSVILGHELRDWRAWYWDAATTHPWAPTPVPDDAAAAAASALPAVMPIPTTMPSVAPTPAPPCGAPAPGESLAFMDPAAGGAACAWLATRADGTHLIVTLLSGTMRSDLGIVAAPRAEADVRAFSPSGIGAPVLVVVGGAYTADASVSVVTWRSRFPEALLRANGRRVDVTTDAAGWPRITVTGTDGVKTWVWSGAGFSRR